MTNLIIGLLVTMVFSAFFSGMEIAFVSSNRLRAEMDREKNGLAQRAIDVFYRHPNNFVSTMLVGNNIALVIYGILFAKIFDATLFYPLSDGMRVACDKKRCDFASYGICRVLGNPTATGLCADETPESQAR